jgi:hypothetical protein
MPDSIASLGCEFGLKHLFLGASWAEDTRGFDQASCMSRYPRRGAHVLRGLGKA